MSRKPSRHVLALSLVLAWCALQACTGRPRALPSGASSKVHAHPATPVEEALAARGFVVGRGTFEFLDMSDCCELSCAGNNPASPYASFFVPPAPSEAPSSDARPDGTANFVRLRADEAIVFVGPLPPPAKYFGFTPYVMDRSGPLGVRRPVFASLSETLNDQVIASQAGRTAVIAAADSTTVARVKEGLLAAGVPEAALNVIVLDPALGRFGLDERGDTFGVLFRLAVPDDTAQMQAYVSAPGGEVYRLTPEASAPSAPLPSPPARPKDLARTEASLAGAVERLEAAIKAAHAGFDATSLPLGDGIYDPAACLASLRLCLGDNRDTHYPSTTPSILFTSDEDFFVVYGVDHAAVGKATYSGISVYALRKLVGVAGVTSEKFAGSAARYLPGDVDAPRLYAYVLARTCAGRTHCLEVPRGDCPSGIDDGKVGILATRPYLEPGTHTGPAPTTLIRDRVLRFRR